jgi:protein-tyrosine phosphatase
MICDYATKSSLKEVPDPYYGGEDGFNLVIDLLLDARTGLLDEVSRGKG